MFFILFPVSFCMVSKRHGLVVQDAKPLCKIHSKHANLKLNLDLEAAQTIATSSFQSRPSAIHLPCNHSSAEVLETTGWWPSHCWRSPGQQQCNNNNNNHLLLQPTTTICCFFFYYFYSSSCCCCNHPPPCDPVHLTWGSTLVSLFQCLVASHCYGFSQTEELQCKCPRAQNSQGLWHNGFKASCWKHGDGLHGLNTLTIHVGKQCNLGDPLSTSVVNLGSHDSNSMLQLSMRLHI